MGDRLGQNHQLRQRLLVELGGQDRTNVGEPVQLETNGARGSSF
jgi:hypothetical protein